VDAYAALKGAPDDAFSRSSYHLADHMGEAPILVIPCAGGDPARLLS
jgi:hypothetical protein